MVYSEAPSQNFLLNASHNTDSVYFSFPSRWHLQACHCRTADISESQLPSKHDRAPPVGSPRRRPTAAYICISINQVFHCGDVLCPFAFQRIHARMFAPCAFWGTRVTFMAFFFFSLSKEPPSSAQLMWFLKAGGKIIILSHVLLTNSHDWRCGSGRVCT